MPYHELISPSTLPPKVTRVISKLERHYLRPIHVMFRLPVPKYRLVGEFQFSIAHLLLGAIAGVSTTLYAHEGSKGERYRQLLVNYYPFSLETGNNVPALNAARTLWSVFRNPLAHDLGFDLEKNAKTPMVKVFRVLTNGGAIGRTEKMIESLEETSVRPQLKPTLQIQTDATVLSVDSLYWGVRHTIETLLADNVRIQAAEKNLPPI